MNIHPSSLNRLELCPGSLEAQKGLPDSTGPEAESGNRVHAGLRDLITMQTLPLSAMDFELKAEHVAKEAKLAERETIIVKWFGEIIRKVVLEHGGAVEIHKECPGEMPFASKTKITGTPDLWVVCQDGTIHVFEYKTGWAEQDTADLHLQGQCYGVLVADARKEDCGVTVHILAAGNEKGETHTLTDYNPGDLDAVADAIRSIIAEAMKKNAPRKPGFEQCQYCKARGTGNCPESTTAVEKFATQVEGMKEPEAVFGALEPEQRAAAVANCKLVAAVAKRILDAAKQALKEDPEAIPGWEIGEGRKTRSIENPQDAYNLLAVGFNLLPTEFADCVTVHLSKVEVAVYERLKANCENIKEKPPTKKAVKEQVAAKLAPVIAWKTSSGSLKKSKPAE